jgi:hypothetical protein
MYIIFKKWLKSTLQFLRLPFLKDEWALERTDSPLRRIKHPSRRVYQPPRRLIHPNEIFETYILAKK